MSEQGRVISYPCGCVENLNVTTSKKDRNGKFMLKGDAHCAEYSAKTKVKVTINKGTQNEKTIERYKCEYLNQRE